MSRVLVVGAGVVGLSCAVRLLEAGHRVDVLARDLPLETTSSVAAAVWSPYITEQAHVLRWSRTAYDTFADLAHDPATGVAVRWGTEVFRERGASAQWWYAALPPGAGPDRETHLPEGWGSGWTMRCPVIEMPLYLAWLAGRVEALGGTLTRMNLSGLPTYSGVLVVNATGLASRHFASDPSVTPVRGQVVVVEQVGLETWMLDDQGPTYVIPRSRDIVVGGTAQPGEWTRTPDPETAASILARATQLVPEIVGARVLRHKVGLRPVRPAVRLERVGDVIHCYGHGGCGVTVSWGCAGDVVELADG